VGLDELPRELLDLPEGGRLAVDKGAAPAVSMDLAPEAKRPSTRRRQERRVENPAAKVEHPLDNRLFFSRPDCLRTRSLAEQKIYGARTSDFPAPVDPLRTFKPSPKESSASATTARFWI